MPLFHGTIKSSCHPIIIHLFSKQCFELTNSLTNRQHSYSCASQTIVLHWLPWLQCSEYSAFHCTVSWNNVYTRQMEFQETKHLYFFTSEMHRYRYIIVQQDQTSCRCDLVWVDLYKYYLGSIWMLRYAALISSSLLHPLCRGLLLHLKIHLYW